VDITCNLFLIAYLLYNIIFMACMVCMAYMILHGRTLIYSRTNSVLNRIGRVGMVCSNRLNYKRFLRARTMSEVSHSLPGAGEGLY
jgi:hypothetical protein